jgi:anaerobic magnesium-protoporphyrin IX monomethyl ester cyclase
MDDVLLLVPMCSAEALWLDPRTRGTSAASITAPLSRARIELELYLGRPLSFRLADEAPVFGGERMAIRRHRTLTAVALADRLERARLLWKAVDPGPLPLAAWRRMLALHQPNKPRVVAVSTTFGDSATWFLSFCTLVRRMFPESMIVFGGAYYATNAESFLSLDADVFCLGEGEAILPEIVRAVRDGAPLDGLAGLCLRGPDGSLRFTRSAEPQKLSTLEVPDWRLAERMDPPVDLERDHLWYHVETVRGCYFRCQFCTYTTLARFQPLEAETRARRILEMARFGRGVLFLTDATASFPVLDWRRTLQILIEHGGSPLPIGAFTRLPDLDDETVALMAQANVRWALIGLDSGDQAVLNAMKKGTKVGQVLPALGALARHGVGAHVFCIFGFPGETPATAQATRDMVVRLNDGHERAPPVFGYNAEPWMYQDLAPIATRSAYDRPSSRWAAEQVLETYVAASRPLHAPVSFLTPDTLMLVTSDPGLCEPRARFRLHRWLKAIERGIAVFAERELEGKVPNDAELRSLKQQIVASLPPLAENPVRDSFARAGQRARATVAKYLNAEWLAEIDRGVGPMTRLLLAVSYARAYGDLSEAAASGLRGAWPDPARAAAYASALQLKDATGQLIALERARNARRPRDRSVKGPLPDSPA